MFDLPRPALAGGLLWILACLTGFVLIARKGSRPRAPGAPGYPDQFPGRYPGLLLVGIGNLALAPVVSAVQYIATQHQLFGAGAWVLSGGLLVIAYHLLLTFRPSAGSSRSASGFREKSAVLQMVAILVVYGFYAVRLWDFWSGPQAPVTVTAIGALIAITIWMILIGIASHIALVLYMRPEMPDERDRLIDLRGSRNAYFVLATGVWCVLILAIAHVPHGALFYAIMGAFAVAELARLGSQVLYYRLGT